jgi:hypothetical protein
MMQYASQDDAIPGTEYRNIRCIKLEYVIPVDSFHVQQVSVYNFSFKCSITDVPQRKHIYVMYYIRMNNLS